MSDVTDALQGVPEGEPVATPAEETTQPDTGQAEETTTETQPEGDKPEEPKSPPEWAQKRIDALTREKWEARREAETLRQQLEQFTRGQREPQDEQPDASLPKSEIERIATQRALEIADTARFNEDSNRAYEAGKSEFTDFDDSLRNLGLAGALQRHVIDAALATGEAHRVLYQLGKDPDRAAALATLPPVQLGVAMAKLATSTPAAPKAKPVSAAPPPVKPIDGGARRNDDPEKMSMDDWMKWRNRQIDAGA